MPRLILIPLNKSDHSEKAFDYYVQDIRREDDKVMLLHTHELHPPLFFVLEFSGGCGLVMEKVIEQQRYEIQRLGEKYEEKCKSAGINEVEFKVVEGPAREKIVEIARETGPDMIVMGMRVSASFKRSILGSVSDYVACHSDVPTVIVPG